MSTRKQLPKLQSTSAYSKFELCRFNRSVKKTAALKKSMQKHGFIPAYPLHCIQSPDGRLEIKAGHHRFEVAQELGLPVFYVVSNDDATIAEFEVATNPWSAADYLDSFAKCGDADYAEAKAFHERTGIPLSMCLSMLSGQAAGSGNYHAKLKRGDFVIKDRSHANSVADIVAACEASGIESRRQTFVQALSRCLFVKEFSPSTFKARAEANPHLFKKARTVDEQLQIFEDVYNHKARAENRVPLTFLAKRAASERHLGGLKPHDIE